MIRRVIGLAVLVCVLALLGVSLWAWQLRVTKPAMPQLEGELRSSSLAVHGRQRTFAFYVPPRVRPNPQLLLVLHGLMMDGEQMRVATGYAFDEIADREGFLVAYPDGYRGHWNDCRAVGDYEAKRLAINDVAFLKTLTDWFRREYNVATNEVFAVGVSNGGQMSYRLALEAPDLVRAIAAIAANLPTTENQTCVPSGRPVATMIVNGTDDPLNPHGGGRVALFGIFFRRGNVQSTLATATYWANLAGHHAPPAVQDIPDNDPTDGATATRHRWSSDTRPSVALLVVHGGGHTMPHPDLRFPRILGRTCHDFSSPKEIWEFFAAESHRACGGFRDIAEKGVVYSL
jgi:polyhydroxybutyrate depolymerase